MAQAALLRVLDEIGNLDLNELQSVEHAVHDRLQTGGYSIEEWRAMQSLVDAGLLKEIKPRCTERTAEFTPVSIQGKPLSETIIEERR